MVLSGFINCCLLLFTTEAAAVFRGPRTLLSSSNVLHQGDGFFYPSAEQTSPWIEQAAHGHGSMTKRCRLLVVPHQQQVKFHPYRSLSLFPSLPSSPYPRVGGGQLFWCRRRWWGEAIQGLSHHRILPSSQWRERRRATCLSSSSRTSAAGCCRTGGLTCGGGGDGDRSL